MPQITSNIKDDLNSCLNCLENQPLLTGQTVEQKYLKYKKKHLKFLKYTHSYKNI